MLKNTRVRGLLILGLGGLLGYLVASGMLNPFSQRPAEAAAAKTAEVAASGTSVNMQPGYAKAVGRMAYIWGWPLVNQFNRRAGITKAPKPGRLNGVVPVGPLGQVGMLSDYIQPGEKFVTCPNQDVVYGLGYFALDKEPVVAQVPDFGKRFWVYALYDARTDEFGQLGKQYGTKPGFYLLVGPNWKGERPKGITAIVRSSTGLANVIPRVFMDDTAEDRKAIQSVINQIVFYPLKQFDGKMKTMDWSKAPSIPGPKSTGGETKWVVPEKFFEELGAVLDAVPPLPGEEALYGQFRALLAVGAKDPTTKKALVEAAVETEREVIDAFFQWKHNGRSAGNGWNRSVNNAEWGTDYFNRTGTAKSNMFDNRPKETQYFYTDDDSSGASLDGRNSYTITFAPKQDPPVNGFWSLTLYDERHFFDPNDLKRYSLGTKNKTLKRNNDGSLTLYAGATSPGEDKESNWLPAPKGHFSLYLRAYWGQKPILNGTWKPPAIRKVKGTATPSENREVNSKGDTHFDQLANSPFIDGRPTAETAKFLKDELLFQRAVQTYLWAMPLINTLGMKVGSEGKFGAGYNVLPIWKKRLDAKTLVTTPNSDVIYAMSYVDLGKDGPLVFDAPPKLQGILLDFWQRPIPGPTIRGHNFFGDVGFFGPDGGKGGKFLLLPPGHKGYVPDGYYVYRSQTNNVFIFLRGFFEDPTNLTPAVSLMEKSRIYPLNNEKGAKKMVFPDASGVAVDMLPRSSIDAFRQLKQLVDSEPPSLADPDWMGMLAEIGIKQGKLFKPDERTKQILDAAAKTAYKMSRVLGMAESADGVSYRVYKDREWANPMTTGDPFTLTWMRTGKGYRALNARINFFTNYYSWAPSMMSETPGKGANYMVSFRDADGKPLDGASHYKLHLPAKVPAKIFWSVTLYDVSNSSGLANGQPFPSIGSRDKPRQNDDGSFDLSFGPKPPEGEESNWRATVPRKGFFAIIRLYGPTEASFDKNWKPGDFEKMK
jgi:hypothetical protein